MATTQMDYSDMQNSANGFSEVAGTLRAVSVALEAAMILLRTTAFIGVVGGAAVAAYLENIKPHVDRLAQTCDEMSGDLLVSMRIHQQTDESTAPRFED